MRLGLRHRPALVVAILVFLAGVPLVALGLSLPLRSAMLVAWCLAASFYAAVATWQLLRASAETLRSHAQRLDDSRSSVLALSLAAALAALTGVVWEIGAAGPATPFAVPLGFGTILVSWTFLHLAFAHLYAHEHMLTGGFEFPGRKGEPDGYEFLYVALTIGMTCQVSDVTTSSPAMRRLVLAHGVVSFIFNAAFVAAGVNLLSQQAAR